MSHVSPREISTPAQDYRRLPPGGKEEQVGKRHQAFKDGRKKERKERMKASREPTFKAGCKTFMAKARAAICKKLRRMPTDRLVAFNESTHGRFEATER